MADREAFREFQSRLASRLQASHTEGAQSSWLAVQARGMHYLLPLAQAGEVFPATPPQTVPYTQPWFLGVASLRGNLYGVIDLAGFMDREATLRTPRAPETEWRLVALNPALELQSALQVDRLGGLRGIEDFATSDPPQPGASAWLGSRYVAADGSCWQELDLQALSQQAQFLRISL